MNGTWHRAFMMSKKAIISFACSHNVCFKMLAYGDNTYFGALKRKTIEKNGEKFKAQLYPKAI